MKILAIRIKNLASLEGTTEIDFTAEPLRSAGLFAITGPTGAGKSTILDALCLALYAKTPRYLQAKEQGIFVEDVGGKTISQGDIRGILRDGTADGFAEVDFVGVDKDHYRATWNIRRARNKAEGSLQDYTMALENLSKNTIVPGKKSELLPEIERLVGLNFEQFTRSALLAQGDFTAFLKAPRDEKSSLLEKLTGTHIYSEISQRIFEKHRNEAQELRDLNLKREGITTLTQEELDTFILVKTNLKVAFPKQEEQRDLLIEELKWHTDFSVKQENLVKASEINKIAVQEKKNATEREQNLKKTERVQSARSLVDAKENTKKQLITRAEALKEIKNAKLELQNQKIRHEELLKLALEDLAIKTKRSKDATPLIDEAKALDVQIKDKEPQLKDAKLERDADLEKQKQHIEVLGEKQKESTELITDIEKLETWKEENSARKEIAENQMLIVSKLNDAKKQLNDLKQLTSTIENTEGTIELQSKESDLLIKASNTIDEEHKTAKLQNDTLQKSIATINISVLEEEKTAIGDLLEDRIGAEAQWRLFSSKQFDFNDLNRKLADNKTEIQSKKTLLEETNKQVNILKIQQDTSHSILQKARLASTENVETLRSQLVDGDACPVCGSEEHPYALHNPQLDYVLSQLEEGYKNDEQRYLESLKTQSNQESSISQLKITIADQGIQAEYGKSALKQLQSDWEKFATQKDCEDVLDEEKLSWIKAQILSQKEAQKNTNEKIYAYQLNKQKLEDQQQIVTNLNEQTNENANKIKDLERSVQSQKEKLDLYIERQGNLNIELSSTEKLLSPYFTSTDWFAKWKNNSDEFVNQINAFSISWKENIKKLDDDSKKDNLVAEQLKNLQINSEAIQYELDKKETHLSTINRQLKEISDKRKLIFDGKTVRLVENDLQFAVDTAQQTLNKHNEEREKLQITTAQLQTKIDESAKQIESLEQQQKQQVENLQQWFIADHIKNASTLTEEEVLQLLAHTPKWIETERAFLRGLDDAIIQAKSIHKEREDALTEHENQRKSERLPDELEELLFVAKEILREAAEKGNKIKFELDQDYKNKKAIGGLLITINDQALIVENWAKLNEAIGSADGKKFREIAQEYTLDILLGYANAHLEILSKRYLLQRIPETLGLQVLDQDMGNEIRTVFSLSGGESFLVSLALALGLASLSSSRMQVESLFIDEGFGSLDPTTLNVAMDALERLHNQGRKVGVISHVQEMTERIPVQISVSKENSGRSKVEII